MRKSSMQRTVGASLIGAGVVGLALAFGGQRSGLSVGYAYWLMLLLAGCAASHVAASVAAARGAVDGEEQLWPVAVVEAVVLPCIWAGVVFLMPAGSPIADLLIHAAVLVASWGACAESRLRGSAANVAPFSPLDLHRVPLVSLIVADLWTNTLFGYALATAVALVLVALSRKSFAVPVQSAPAPAGTDADSEPSRGSWSSESKARFFTMAAHDLQQPLQGMRLALQAYQYSSGAKQASELVSVIEESVKNLTALVDEILDVARTDSRLGAPQFTRVDIAKLLSELELTHRPVAESVGLKLLIDAGPALVYTDPVLLKRAVGNLVSNALRYTKAGAVVVRGVCKAGVLSLDVMDTGPGIRPEDRERVFEEFYRGNATEPSSGSGYGLGLPIVKRICHDLGIEVRLESELGKGTCVRLIMNAAEVAAGDSAHRGASEVAVLLAMCPGAERTNVEGMLAAWGVDVCPSTAPMLEADIKRNLDAGKRPIAVMDSDCFSRLPFHDDRIIGSPLWATAGGALVILTDELPERVRDTSIVSAATILSSPVKPIQLRAFLNHHLSPAQVN
jgi:signal transduction histidine kinase